MKIYISADMEGVSGIVDTKQCAPTFPEFNWALKLWVQQINAVVEGFIESGVSEIVVNEAHSAMNYIPLDMLHPGASLISGYVKTDNQMEGIDESFSGSVFIGHAKAGTEKATLNHTYVMRDVLEIRLNGEPIGEIGLNAYWAAYHNVPLIMIVGDDKAASEAKGLIPEIETAVVKKGISQFSAHHLSLNNSLAVIKDCAKRAFIRAQKNEIPIINCPPEYVMEIDFSISEIANLCSFIPGVIKIGARTIQYSSKDYRDIQHVRIVCTNLALATIRSHF